MISCFLSVFLSACHRPAAIDFVQVKEVQLSRPDVSVSQVFFSNSAWIYVHQPPSGCQIYYTDNGQIPNQQSPVVSDSMRVENTASLRFKTIGKRYQASEEVGVDLFRLQGQAISIASSTIPTAPYDQAATTILIDQQKGSANFRDGQWLGYQTARLSFDLELAGNSINGLTLSVLEDQNSWIFAPDSLRVQFYDEANTLLAEGQLSYDAASSKVGAHCRFISVEVEEIKATRAMLSIHNLIAIPDWHPGNGHTPWLFIDEILLR